MGGTVLFVEKIIVHPGFKLEKVQNDISLVEVKGHIDTNIGVPVKLPLPFQQVIADTSCLVSGWGETFDSKINRDELRAVNAPIWSQEKCRAAYPEHIFEYQVCAAYEEGGKATCLVNQKLIKNTFQNF